METTPDSSFFVISTYSREEALVDGTLIDCSREGREAGLAFPVAVTAAVHAACIAWDNEKEQEYQDESGRCWDVVTMLRLACQKARNSDTDTVFFSVLCIPSGGRVVREVQLKAVVGPGDAREPVLTVLLPDED